jgi:hypothetical protein
LARNLGIAWSERDDVAAYVVAWLAGVCILVLGLTIVVGTLGLPAQAATIAVLAIVTGHGVVTAYGNDRDSEEMVTFAVDWRSGVWLIAALLLIAVPLIMIRTNQPYPIQTGWGVFNYNYHLLRFQEWNEIGLERGLHTPFQPAVAGVAGIATGASVEGLLWAIPVLQYLVFGVGTYLLGRRLTNSSLLSLAILWIALWILALQIFRHLHAANLRGAILAISPWLIIVLLNGLSSVPFQPRALALRLALPAAVMGAVALIRWVLPGGFQPWLLLSLLALTLYALRQLPNELRAEAALLALVGGSLAFIHLFEGPIFFAAALAFVLVLAWKPVTPAWRAAIVGVYTVTVTFILIQTIGWLSFSDPSMISRLVLGDGRANAIEIPFRAKLDLLRRGLPFLIMGLLGWSALRTLVRPQAQHLAALLCISLAMFTYFLPESGLHRVLGAIIVLIAVAVALEMHWIAEQVTLFLTKRPNPAVTGLLIAVALIAMTPTLTYSLRWQVGLDTKLGFPLPDRSGNFSGSTLGEYEAARWMAEHTPEDWAVVSDPTTMFIMQGLTLRPQVAEKRAWVAESEYTVGDQERLASLDEQVFLAPTDEGVLAGLRAVTEKHDGAMIVFSYRTLDWLMNDDPFSLRRPQQVFPLFPEVIDALCENAELAPCPSRLFRNDAFHEVYHYNGVAIIIPSSQLAAFEAQLD